MPIFELRQYVVRDGKMKEWLELMEREIFPFQVSKGAVYTASFVAEDNPTTYIWIRRFENEAEKVQLYKDIYESDHWKTVISPQIDKLLHRDKSVIQRLLPTRASPMQ